jgi:formyltetrahydrofolate deformylase
VTAQTKPAAEAAPELVAELDIDLVVLAAHAGALRRRLQPLAGRAINIHHSFLPSFKGARPYHQARRPRGQAHRRHRPLRHRRARRGADHRAGGGGSTILEPEQLAAVGRDLESQALARAVLWHAEDRVLLNGHRTVVFR